MKCQAIFLTSLFALNACNNESNIPVQYDGYAILQTKDLPDDGGDDFTFYLLPELNKRDLIAEIDYNQYLLDKSITFIFTQGKDYINYKIELNKRNWNQDEDLILVKVNYDILNPQWVEDTKIQSKKITIGKEDHLIQDYNFIFLVDIKGKSLYKINNIEFIRKIN